MTTILACGDVGVRRADCASMFYGCREQLGSADLCLAQLETTVSDRGSKAPNAKLAMRGPPAMAAALRAAGFHVVSFASNHCLDFGYEAFADTLRHVRAAGLELCGAGETLALARAPVVLRVGGLSVAVLAACAILPEGYAAETDRPGCAPLRALTLFEPVEPDQPGTPPRIRSFAHRADLAALTEAIALVRTSADLVLVSLHWGIHMMPFTLAEYQIEVAHTLIDAGADAILGHHPHLLKGVELYRGRPIFYSLGNFAIEQPQVWDETITASSSFRHLMSLNPTWDLHQHYTLPENTRPSGLAKLVVRAPGQLECRFVPSWIGDDSAPTVLGASDPRFERVAGFLEQSTRVAGFATQLRVDGDELLLS